jgi:16S rRNA (cytosine1402-N4)-methyltransferase
MVKETVDLLNLSADKTFIDCTLGGGGHSHALLATLPQLKIYAFDQDAEALTAAKKRLANFNNIYYVKDNFANLANQVKEKADGILFDLGISSYQIDKASRGFSLQLDGPLDMRMDQTQSLTAEDILNSYSLDNLAMIFKEYGEERFSRKVAQAITQQRSASRICSTQQLKTIIEKAIPTWKKRESVTRIFQALRITVNAELDNLHQALQGAISLLKPHGRIVVISYHSLEDRIIKQTFRQLAQNDILKIMTKKPLTASDQELLSNPRACSAKLRAAEKR